MKTGCGDAEDIMGYRVGETTGSDAGARRYRRKAGPPLMDNGTVLPRNGIGHRSAFHRLVELEAELREAASVQEGFTRRQHPRVAGFDVHATATPAGWMSGDHHYIGDLGGGSLEVVVSDAMGHGPAAALLAAQMHALLHARPKGDWTPVKSADWLNDVFCQALANSARCAFITALFAVIQPSGRVRFCSAGHPAPILLKASGTTVVPTLPGSGALGMSRGTRYGEKVLQLDPGDALVLYSDGVTDARNGDGEFFGEAGLLMALRALGGRRSKDIADGLIDFAVSHDLESGNRDDKTVLVVRRRLAP